MIRAAVLTLCMATSATAQDLPFPPQVVESCLAGGVPDLCIGLIARACMEQDGARGPCLGLENRYWLDRIATLTADLAGIDLRVQSMVGRVAAPSALSDLAGVNAAHAALVERRCAYESTAWSGMHSGPVEYECRVRENARHAIWLRGILADG